MRDAPVPGAMARVHPIGRPPGRIEGHYLVVVRRVGVLVLVVGVLSWSWSFRLLRSSWLFAVDLQIGAWPSTALPGPGRWRYERGQREREHCRRSQSSEIAAPILTSFEDDDALFSVIMAGAACCVLKQVFGSDLIETVRRVAAGRFTLDPAVTQQVLDRLRRDPEEVAALAPLTAQERRIVELIGEGMTNRQIAKAVFLARKTVKNHVSAMLPSFGMERRAQAVVFTATYIQR